MKCKIQERKKENTLSTKKKVRFKKKERKHAVLLLEKKLKRFIRCWEILKKEKRDNTLSTKKIVRFKKK